MALKVVVLGAGGLLGQRFCQHLVKQKELYVGSDGVLPLRHIVLFDMVQPKLSDDVIHDSRIKIKLGDLCDAETIRTVIEPENGVTRVTVFHFAAVLSGNAEDNFDLGMKVNIFGTLNVMDRIRELGTQTLGGPQIYVYTSSDYVACFNDRNKKEPFSEEGFRLSPASYGVQKACMELLISDYSRKGFIDGRVGRISAIIGRPGFSNSISSAYSMIFTQTLLGKDYTVTISMDALYPVSSLNNNVSALLYLGSKLASDTLGRNRVVQIPAISTTLTEIWSATQQVAAEEDITLGSVHQATSTSGKTTFKEINVVPRVDCRRAKQLGLPADVNLTEIIRDFVRTYIKK